MKPAENLTDLYNTVDPDEPLHPKDERYVDLSSARGADDLAKLITRRIITSGPSHYHRRLITGHRGSGKSTELHRLESMLTQEDFLVVYLDVETSLDLADLEYLDVLVAIAQRLYDVTTQRKIRIDEKLLHGIEEWFSEVVSIRETNVVTDTNIHV